MKLSKKSVISIGSYICALLNFISVHFIVEKLLAFKRSNIFGAQHE